jgi:hypothetical protein
LRSRTLWVLAEVLRRILGSGPPAGDTAGIRSGHG